MKSIIEREATFENNSDTEVKVTQKQLSRAEVIMYVRFTVMPNLVKIASSGTWLYKVVKYNAFVRYYNIFSFPFYSCHRRQSNRPSVV